MTKHRLVLSAEHGHVQVVYDTRPRAGNLRSRRRVCRPRDWNPNGPVIADARDAVRAHEVVRDRRVLDADLPDERIFGCYLREQTTLDLSALLDMEDEQDKAGAVACDEPIY